MSKEFKVIGKDSQDWLLTIEADSESEVEEIIDDEELLEDWWLNLSQVTIEEIKQ